LASCLPVLRLSTQLILSPVSAPTTVHVILCGYWRKCSSSSASFLLLFLSN